MATGQFLSKELPPIPGSFQHADLEKYFFSEKSWVIVILCETQDNMSEAHLGRNYVIIMQKCNEEIKEAVVGCAIVYKSRDWLQNDTDKAISDHLRVHDTKAWGELLVGLMS